MEDFLLVLFWADDDCLETSHLDLEHFAVLLGRDISMDTLPTSTPSEGLWMPRKEFSWSWPSGADCRWEARVGAPGGRCQAWAGGPVGGAPATATGPRLSGPTSADLGGRKTVWNNRRLRDSTGRAAGCWENNVPNGFAGKLSDGSKLSWLVSLGRFRHGHQVNIGLVKLVHNYHKFKFCKIKLLGTLSLSENRPRAGERCLPVAIMASRLLGWSVLIRCCLPLSPYPYQMPRHPRSPPHQTAPPRLRYQPFMPSGHGGAARSGALLGGGRGETHHCHIQKHKFLHFEVGF